VLRKLSLEGMLLLFTGVGPVVRRLPPLFLQLLLNLNSILNEFVHALDPQYVLPTCHCVSQLLIPERYKKSQEAITTDLESALAPSMTTDMWTSSSNVSYMGVTAHWVDQEFEPHNKCLAVRPVLGSHTANFISKELSAVCHEWSVDVGESHVVTDSSANVKKAITQLPIQKWHPCFAHNLQLVVNNALASKEVSDVPKIVSKARSIVGHFRRSPLATTQLQKAQEQIQIPQQKLIQDCPTRWNSQVGQMRDFFVLCLNLCNVLMGTYNGTAHQS